MKPPAVLLAGGRSSRMGGGDKCLLPVQGKPLIAHILERLAPQTRDVLINTNSDPGPFLKFGLPILPDAIAGFQGPLAGLLTGMLWSRRRHPHQAYMLSVAGDVPFLPRDLVARLHASLTGGQADIAIAAGPDGGHPTIGLWPVDLAERLEHDLMETNIRSMLDWSSTFHVARTPFSADVLVNINTPAELDFCQDIYPGNRRLDYAAKVI
jgi:molybdopterin-guanine dinucleotide biosynthesis protein A